MSHSWRLTRRIQLPRNDAATTATRLTVESNTMVRAGSDSCQAQIAMPTVPGTHKTTLAANAALGMTVCFGRLTRYAMIAAPMGMVMGIQTAQKCGVHGRAWPTEAVAFSHSCRMNVNQAMPHTTLYAAAHSAPPTRTRSHPVLLTTPPRIDTRTDFRLYCRRYDGYWFVSAVLNDRLWPIADSYSLPKPAVRATGVGRNQPLGVFAET